MIYRNRAGMFVSPAVAAEMAKRAFPNLSVTLRDECSDRLLSSRRIGRHSVTYLQAPRTTVEASSARARQAGLSRCFKLIWQFEGTMRYEDSGRSLLVRRGEILVTAMAGNYCLDMHEDHEGLVVMVDPDMRPSWLAGIHRAIGKSTLVCGPLAAVAAGATSLLRHASSSADVLTVEALIDVALQTLLAEPCSLSERPLPAMLLRARLMVTQNIGEEAYGPDRLAHDLGLSRRSLYNAFGRLGMTPAQFIRRQRLAHAKADLAEKPDASIAAIALSNGFADGAAFSHAFRAHYGVSPRECRRSVPRDVARSGRD